MAANLELLVAVFMLLPSGSEMGAHDLVFLEVDAETSDENFSSTLQDLLNIPEGLILKEFGTTKYFAVLREPYLSRIKLRDVIEVTLMEEIEETTEKFNFSWPPHRDINNTILMLFKFSSHLRGQTLQQFNAEFKHAVRRFAPTMQNLPHRAYISKGSIPLKFYSFINVLDDITLVCKNSLDFVGGPAAFEAEASYVHILHLPVTVH